MEHIIGHHYERRWVNVKMLFFWRFFFFAVIFASPDGMTGSFTCFYHVFVVVVFAGMLLRMDMKNIEVNEAVLQADHAW